MGARITPDDGGTHKIDPVERHLIQLLQHDGRMTVTQLARSLGVTEVTTRRKLRRLLTDGVIRVVATVDPFDVGYDAPAIIGVKVHRGRLDEVAEQLSALPEVRYIGASTGRADLIIEVVTRTSQDLARFLTTDLVNVDGILDSETSFIFRIYKQSWHAFGRPSRPARDEADAGPTSPSEGASAG